MDDNYSNYYYNRKKEKRQSNWWVIALIIIMTACFAAFILVYATTKNKEGITRRGNVVSNGEVSFYAVSLGKLSLETEANALSISVRNRGGAGFILSENGFEVLAACYAEKEQAEKVIKQVVTGGDKAELVVLQIPAYTLTLNDEEQAKLALEFMTYLQEMQAALQNAFIQLDKNSTTRETVVMQLEVMEKRLADFQKTITYSKLSTLAESLAKQSALAKAAINGKLLSNEVKYLAIYTAVKTKLALTKT